MPRFAEHEDAPLVYVSFGSLGAGDTDLLKRIIAAFAGRPYRVLVNVGDYLDAYDPPPPNVHLASWYPQPSVIPQADAVIHHGGNNSFTECLYFGKPALIMPYVWDGHDNATRVAETGHGFALHRYDWTDEDLLRAIDRLIDDPAMRDRLVRTSSQMQRPRARRLRRDSSIRCFIDSCKGSRLRWRRGSSPSARAYVTPRPGGAPPSAARNP